MSTWLKFELCLVTLTAILLTCVQGLKIDFSRLALHRSPLFSAPKRNGFGGNPCEASQPFLCRESPQCVALKFVCDGTWDCDDGFDEDPAVCNAASRPSFDDLFFFLKAEKNWIIPKLFNGADPELVAHSLTVASDMDDLQNTIGLTDHNVELLKEAFKGASEGDERPLLRMGMPDRSWNEVQYVLQKLMDSGFKY